MPRPNFTDTLHLLGAPHGRKRWRDLDTGRLYEYDSQHGELEMYNNRGKHLGVVDVITGAVIKTPIRGRKIDV